MSTMQILTGNYKLLHHLGFRQYGGKASKQKWQIMQFSSIIMIREAKRRIGLIRKDLEHGVNVRVEIWEKSVQEPDLPRGSPLHLRNLIANSTKVWYM